MQATLIISDNPFDPASRTVKQITRRRRIDKLAPTTDLPFICLLNGKPLLRKNKGWHKSVKDGDVVIFVIRPQGGGGGGSNPLTAVLSIAISLAAPGLAAGILGPGLAGTEVAFGITAGQLLGGAISLVGKMAVNAMFGGQNTPKQVQQQNIAAPSPTYSLTAQGNAARLLEPIPVIYGRHLIYPDFGAEPYTDYAGNEQYLYSLLVIGQGDYVIEAIRIEDTEIDHFPEVTYQVVPPGADVTLFPANVVTVPEVSGQEMLTSTPLGPFVVNAAGTEVNAIAVDVVCPQGLFYATDDGGLATMSVQFKFEVRSIDAAGAPVGDWQAVTAEQTFYYSNYWAKGYWARPTNPLYYFPPRWTQTGYGSTVANDHHDGDHTGATVSRYQEVWRWMPFGADPHPPQEYVASVPDLTLSDATNTPIRTTYKFSLAAGRYEIRATRTDTKSTSARAGHTLLWAGARGYIPGAQNYGSVTLLAIKMRATNSLSAQTSRRVNLIVTRKLPTWNGSAWGSPVATRNPAWAMADVLMASYGGKLQNARVALSELVSLAAVWDARGDTFDAIFDQRTNIFDAVTSIGFAGRCKPYQQGAVWHFWRDQQQTLPVVMFNTRNTVKNSSKRSYLVADADTADCIDVEYFDGDVWAWKTVRAKLPGASETNPAKLRAFGITNRDRAWKWGMWQCANNRYRRNLVTLQTEMEGFIPTFGDLVAVQYDIPTWGQAGDVVGWDSGTLTITTSEPLDWSAGGNHYVRLRRRNGSGTSVIQVSAGVDDYHVVLASAPDFTPYTGNAEERTTYNFGPANQTDRLCLVRGIRPRSLDRVELSLVVDDPAVYTADTGAAPPESSYWNLPAKITRPTVFGIHVMLGGMTGAPIITASWQPAAGAYHYIAEYSYDNGNSWSRASDSSATNTSFPARQGALSFRVSAIGLAAGQWSYWNGNPMATPMPDVENLATRYRAGQMYLSWRAVVDPRAGEYEIRFGASFASAQKLAVTPLLEFPLIGNGKYWVSAKWLNVYSANPASVVVTGAALEQNVIATFDEPATGWSGTLSDGAIIAGGNIHLAGAGDILSAPDFLALTDVLYYGGIATSGTYTLPTGHAVNIGRVAPCRVAMDYTVHGVSIYDNFLAVPDVLAMTDVLNDAAGAKVAARPQIALAGADGIYGAWQDYLPGEYNAQYFKGRIIIYSTDSSIYPVLSALTFLVDVPDRIDDFNVVLPAGGATISYSPPFNGGVNGNPYPLPQITILNAQPGDDLILSAQSVNGLTAKVTNGGADVTRSINCRPQGY